jgi:hypothetical protein
MSIGWADIVRPQGVGVDGRATARAANLTGRTNLTGFQWISSVFGDDSHTVAISALPQTRSDRRAGSIPHSDH